MKYLVSFIILLLVTSVHAEDSQINVCGENDQRPGVCCESKTDKPPFYISDGAWGDDKQIEDFASIANKEKVDRYIPKGTIIFVPRQYSKLHPVESYRVPFQVATVPKAHLENTIEKIKLTRTSIIDLLDGTQGKERVKKGDVGFIDKRSVRKAGEYVFYVNENAPAYTTPSRSVLNDKLIIPTMKGEEYKVKRCCEMLLTHNSNELREKHCFDDYYFDIVDLNTKEKLEEISYEHLQCGALKDLTAIPEIDEFEFSFISSAVLDSAVTSVEFMRPGIEELEIIYAPTEMKAGEKINKSRIKLLKFPIDPITGLSPYNMQAYNSDDEADSDFYFKPASACGILKLAKEFKQICNTPGCQIQFGDMYHPVSWDVHEGHYGGECVDIRPFRKSKDDIKKGEPWYGTKKNAKGQLIPDLNKRNPEYDIEKTRKFIELAIKNGATDIFYNDSLLNDSFKSLNYKRTIIPKAKDPYWDDWWKIRGNINIDKPKHNNHIHLCFREANPNVCPRK